MTAVCIIGAGAVGGAVAEALARTSVASRVLIVDAAAAVAEGKALDLQQAGAVGASRLRLSGAGFAADLSGFDVYVVADRHGGLEWQQDDGLALLLQRSPQFGAAPLVFAGAGQAGLLHSAARDAGLGGPRLIGSAPEAFASAVRAIVAAEAQVSPGEISLTVLGAPPSGFVIPWSEASIGGSALERVLTPPQQARVAARAARLWPPGPFALGAAAAAVADALLLSSRRAFSVLTMLAGEFGVRDRVGTMPAELSPAGIRRLRVPSLSPRERVQLEVALGR